MKLLNFKDFMKKYKLKNDTMNETELQRVYNYPIYPRDIKIYSNKGFVNIDDGRMGGSHWTCFLVNIINHTILTHLVVSRISFYLNSYLNQ